MKDNMTIEGLDLVRISELAQALKVPVAALFQAGSKGALELHRRGEYWTCDLSSAQQWVVGYRARKQAAADAAKALREARVARDATLADVAR